MTITIDRQLTNFVRPSAHSTFSPSSGDRWMACTGSIKQSEGIPNQTSKYAEEGTLAHSLCEEIFAERFYGIPRTDDTAIKMAMLPDGGEEMIDSCEGYVDLLEQWLNMPHELGKILYFGVEKGIPIFPEEGCFGTADFLIIGTKGCAVIDFKYGRGKEVNAQSTQLKLYALGVFNYLSGLPEDYEFNAVVYQPRISIIPKVGVYSVDEMEEFAVEAYDSIKEALSPEAELMSGNHCFWCPAKRSPDPAKKCPLIKQKAIDIANENFDQFFVDMNEGGASGKQEVTLSSSKRDAALLKIISLYPMIKEAAEAAEEELMFRIQEKKEAIEGVMVRDKVGRRKWKHQATKDIVADIVQTFPEHFPDGKATKVKESPLSITEVKKIVGKGAKDMVESLTIQPMTKQLVVQDEKIQEVLKSLTNYSQMITNDK